MIDNSNYMNALPDAIVCYDLRCRRIYVNSEWERINEIPAHKALNKTPKEVPGVLEPHKEEFQNKICNVIDNGVSNEWDYKYKDNNGIYQHYSIRATPEYNHLGNINCVLTTARNITKFKQVEQRMQKQISYFFESPLTGMAVISKDKNWLRVNQKLCNILGYNFEEFNTITWEELTPAQDLDKEAEQFNKLLSGELSWYKFEKQFIHKNGNVVFTQTAFSCLYKEDNTIDSILVLIEDITERIIAKKTLQDLNNTLEQRVYERTIELQRAIEMLHIEIDKRKEKEKDLSFLNFVFDCYQDITFLIDKKGKFVYANQEACKKFGYSKNELIGTSVHDVNPDITKEQWPKHWQEVKKAGSVVFESLNQTRDKKIFPVEISANYFVLKDKEYIVGTVRDITQRKENKELLEKKEKEFRSLAENLPDNIARWNTEGRYIYLNSTHMKTLGVQNTNEVLGKKTIEVNSHFIQGNKAIESILNKEQDSITIKQDILKHDGKYEIHEVKLVAEKDEKGNILSVLGIGHDITDMLNVQEELKHNEERYRTLAQNADIPIYRYGKDFKRLYVNPAVERLIGKSASKVLGKTPLESRMIHPDYDEVLMNSLKKVFDTKQNDSVELLFVLPNGSKKYFIHNHVPEFASDGSVESVLAIGHDITTQKELAHSEKKFRTLVQNAKTPIYRFDKNFKRLYVNPAVEELVGKSYKELVGKTPFDVKLIDDESISHLKKALDSVFETKRSTTVELKFILANNSRKYFLHNLIPEFDDNGNVETILAISLDLTAQKELEKTEEEFRTLAENSPNIIMRYNKDATRIYANPTFSKQSGIPEDQLCGYKPETQWGVFFDILNMPVEEYQGQISQVIKTGQSDNVIVEWIRKNDGVQVAHNIHLVAERNHTGKIIGALGIGHDITKLQEANRELLLKQFALDHIHDSVFLINKDSSFEYVNKGACKTLGYTEEKLLQLKVDDVDSANWSQKNWQLFWDKLEQQKILTLEVEHIKKDGITFPVEIEVNYFMYNNIPYCMAIARDITERKAYEKRILENEREFRTLAEHTPDTIARYNKKCERTYANPAFCKIAGKTKDELLDKKPTHYMKTSSAIEYEDTLKGVLQSGIESNFELVWKNAKNETLISLIHIVPEYNEKGEIESVLATGRDISKLKEFEKETLKQKEFQDSLLSGVSKAGLNLSVIENGKYIYTNSYAIAKEYGYDPKKLSQTKPDFLTTIHPEDKEKVMQTYKKRLAGEDVPSSYTIRVVGVKGQIEEHELSIVLVPNTDPVQIIVVAKDITEMKKIEREITKQKDFQDTLLKSVAKAGLGLHVIENGKYIYTNDTNLEKEYYGDISAKDKPDFLEAVHPDDREKVALMHQKRLAGEDVPNTYTINLLTKKGLIREHEISVIMIPNTSPIQSIVVTKDITERKNIERRIEFMAHHDILTALPNRLLAKDRATQIFSRTERLGKKAAILFIDLDGFKTINDSLGHSVGDEIIKKVAARLQSCIRGSDTISRQGGDEFIVILPELNDIIEATDKCETLLEQFKAPFQTTHHTISLSASIGISIYPDHGNSFEILLQNADAAMYKAKENGKNDYRIFNEQMKHNLLHMLEIQNDLKSAIENKEFILHYQPQIDISQNKIIGVETLIRWEHPLSGMVPPMDFISIAESTGLIVPIGEWVIQEACTQAALWHKQGKKILVAVNISAIQFKRGNLLKVVKKALKSSNLDPKYLELELTESILIHDTENVLQSVREIKELGVQLSIDDFGTGYSSLAYLKKFAVDKLKIDQSFVKEVLVDKDDANIVKTIIQMAKSFNLRSIAEGVENQEVLDLIKEFGCDEVQGYHFAKPMSAKSFEEYYKATFNSF